MLLKVASANAFLCHVCVRFSSGFSVGGTLDINLVAPVTGYFFKNCRDMYNNQCNKTYPD